MNSLNKRVLVVDDEPPVREALVEILGPRRSAPAGLREAEAELFGEAEGPAPSSATFDFEVAAAANGMESFELVREALALERPFALAFLDVRMPGWDGVETAHYLRELDPKMGIVFITAFSDRSIEEIIERVGPDVGYHCKPFRSAEIRQIATKGVHDWNRTRALEDMIELAAELRSAPFSEAELIHQVARRARFDLKAASIAIHRGPEQAIVRLGRFRQAEALADLQRSLRIAALDGPFFRERDVSFRLANYIFTADLPPGALDRSERFYLLRLFAEQAGQAVEALELRGRLLRQEKLAALGQSMTKVVHDLRQPLTMQKGVLELIDRLPDDAGLIKEALEHLHQTVEDLGGYLNDLMDYAGEPRLERESCSVKELLGEVLERLRHRPDSRVIELEIERDLRARIDRPRLRRAVLNIMINALEAVEGQAGAAVSLRLLARDREAVIAISDNGPGVRPELRDRLFDPFITAGKARGTGLGLAIARQIIEAHGGVIELVEPGLAGARFELRWPLD